MAKATKKPAAKRSAAKTTGRKTASNKNSGVPKHKEFRKNLDLDYSTARYVKQMKNSVSFYVTDNNSGDEVLVMENIDRLDQVSEGLRETLGL